MKCIIRFRDSFLERTKKIKKKIYWNILLISSSKGVRAVATSIAFVKNKRDWSSEEMEVLDVIEKIKRGYEISNNYIEVRDFGAGSAISENSPIEMEMGVVTERKISQIFNIAASPKLWGELIFKITLEYKPKFSLELGTSLGVSAAYQMAGLKLNKTGFLTTIEGAPELADLASENLNLMNYRNFTVNKGKFKDVLPEILENSPPMDLIFIDGHHNRTATMEYFNLIYPKANVDSIFIFDDIDWSEGMKQFWVDLIQDNRVNMVFDLGKWGICIINKRRKVKSRLKYLSINI